MMETRLKGLQTQLIALSDSEAMMQKKLEESRAFAMKEIDRSFPEKLLRRAQNNLLLRVKYHGK